MWPELRSTVLHPPAPQRGYRCDGYGDYVFLVFYGAGRDGSEPDATLHEVHMFISGSYVVNADCTGYLDYTTMLSNPPHPVHGDFVLVDKGDEFFVLDNEDNWVASGVGKKL